MPGRRNTDAPLAALAGSDLAGRFRHWHGTSGRRYLFSVFPLHRRESLDHCPRYEDALLLAVAREDDGSRRILLMEETGSFPDLMFEGSALRHAVAAGANEVHMHLLAKDRSARAAMMRDMTG